MSDAKSDASTVRRSSLAALLLTQGGRGRDGICQTVGAYTGAEKARVRRLWDDLQQLSAMGMQTDERNGVLRLVRPDSASAELRMAVRHAAEQVGADYAYADVLRLAVRKLTGERLDYAAGERRASVVTAGGRHSLFVADKGLANGYAVGVMNGSKFEHLLEVQGLVMGGGRLQVVGRVDGRWRCMNCEDVSLRWTKIERKLIEHVQVPDEALSVVLAHSRRGRTAEFLPAEELSYAWTVAQMLLHGEAKTVYDVALQLGGCTSDVERALDIINCTQVAGQFAAYSEVDASGRIEFEADAQSDVFAAGWPITQREMHAICGALALSGNEQSIAEFSELTGLRSNVIAAQRMASARGQLELCAAA